MADENTKSVAELAADIKADHAKAFDTVKELAESALGKAEKGEKLAEGIKEQTDEALLKMNGLTEQIAEVEQKLARAGEGGEERRKSLGERFVTNDQVKGFLDNEPTSGKVDMRIKATLTTLTTDAAGSVGDGADETRLPGIVELPQRRMTIRDLITPGQMDGNTLEYVQETGFNNNAAPVAEGAAKPDSDIQLDLKSTGAKVIAHWMKASRQALSDVSQLRSTIDQRLLFGLAYAEENQLLNGDGTGQNLSGLVTNSTAYSAAFTPASASIIDTMRLAMLQAALAEFPATGHIMHPTDWARIELTKDGQAKYLIGNPQGTAAPTLWGLPVVATQAMTVDKFMTGAFRMAAQLFDRWDARVEVGYVNDDFTKNLVTILAEERLALAVYRPEALVYGDFGNVT